MKPCHTFNPDGRGIRTVVRENWCPHNGYAIAAGVPAISDLVANDSVNHPSHYTEHPSGVECITITEHMNFCVGNAIKYLWRAGLKSADAVEDLRKAAWYVQREIDRLERAKTGREV